MQTQPVTLTTVSILAQTENAAFHTNPTQAGPQVRILPITLNSRMSLVYLLVAMFLVEILFLSTLGYFIGLLLR